MGSPTRFGTRARHAAGLTRVLVPKRRLGEAAELAAATAGGYVLGDPFDPATTLGPVTTYGQRERIRAYIRSGSEGGAKLLVGGPDAPAGLDRGFFVEPTVFTGDNTMGIAREEIFGPVVVIIPFESEAEAIAIANDSPYGLCAGVWCGDEEHAHAIAKRLRVGRVRINGSAGEPSGAPWRLQAVRHRPGVGPIRDRRVSRVSVGRLARPIPSRAPTRRVTRT